MSQKSTPGKGGSKKAQRAQRGLVSLTRPVRAEGYYRTVQWCTPSTSYLSLSSGTITSVVGNMRRIYANTAAFPAFCGFGMSFAMAELDASSAMVSLWEFYRIEEISVHLFPAGMSHQTGNDQTSVSNLSPGTSILYVPDYRTDAAPTGSTDVNERHAAAVRMISPASTSPIVCRFVPRTAAQVFRSNITTGYAEGQERQWISTDYNDVPHYGFRCTWGTNIAGAATTMTPAFDIRIQYVVGFKHLV